MNTISIRQLSASLLLAFLVVPRFSLPLQAEDRAISAKVNVPFAFDTAAGHFKPGVYTIRPETQHIMSIQGTSNSGFAMTRTEDDGRPAKTGRAVFQKYGEKYFLHEIWLSGNREHLYFFPSKLENQLQIAGNKTAAPIGVELALLGCAR
jgi:hypothetical protein